MQGDDPAVLSRTAGGTRYVTLNRPNTLNALTPRMVDEINRLIAQAATDSEIRVILVRGTGRGFSAGADLSALDDPPRDLLDSINALIRTMVSVPVPVITAVNGSAVGGGVGLALAGDLVYAAEDAYFYLSFTDIGLMPDAGSSWFIPAAIGHARASEMALLGEKLGAAEAAELGLVTRTVPTADLDSYVDRVAKQLERGAPLALEKTKLALRAPARHLLDAALSREHAGQTALLNSPDVSEGVQAKMERRKPHFGPRQEPKQ